MTYLVVMAGFRLIQMRVVLLCGFCLWSVSLLHAQSYVTAETLTGKSAKTYRKAQEALRSGDYEEALKLLDKALGKEPKLVDALLDKAAIWYDRQDYNQASELFAAALRLAPGHQPLAWYQSGLAHMRSGSYAEAAGYFEHFLDLPDTRARYTQRAEGYLQTCRFAAEAVANPVPFDPVPLGPEINSPAPEYLPSLTADGATLYFTRMIGRREDMYYSTLTADGWTHAKPVPGLNTPADESAQSIAADGRTLVFTANYGSGREVNYDLYISERDAAGWSRPRPFGEPVNSPHWESQPSLSADGSLLYFASRRPDGLGGKDIWYSRRNEDGHWGAPVNAGPQVNTPLDDQAPFLHPDGQSLYFMSEGHPGMGKADLFLTRLDRDGQWQAPKNLGYPINTPAEEGALIVNLDGDKAWYTSDRKDSTGRRFPDADIYTFELYEEARPKPVTYVRAVVRDARSGKPLRAEAEVAPTSESAPSVRTTTDERGAFLLCLPAGKNYALYVSAEGYLFYSDHFELREGYDRKNPYLLNVDLEPLTGSLASPEGVPVVLRNVFFASGSAILKPESEAELDRLVGLLNAHPDMRIRINGHTDKVGSEEDNLELSRDRARAVHDYLIRKEIDPSRLTYKGFGESQPIATNDTEEGRRQNRRTEFELIK